MEPAKKTVKLQPSTNCFADLLGFHLRRASQAVQADLAESLAPFDLRMITFSALSVIEENPGLRQGALADALAIERPNLVVIVDELEGRDLIRRDQVPSDRRAYALKMTDAGTALLRAARGAIDAHEAALFGALSSDERAKLISTLQDIRRKGTAK